MNSDEDQEDVSPLATTQELRTASELLRDLTVGAEALAQDVHGLFLKILPRGAESPGAERIVELQERLYSTLVGSRLFLEELQDRLGELERRPVIDQTLRSVAKVLKIG